MRARALVLSLSLAILIAPLVTGVAGSQAEPSPVDPLDVAEPALLSDPIPRGGISWDVDQATQTSTAARAVDGDPSDWVGQPSRLGGTTVLDRGELIYQAFLFDDFGADDGKDAQRNEDLGPAYAAEPRLERVEALTQAAGEQFGADEDDPTEGYLTGPAHYGDAQYPSGAEGQADLVEVRVAADQTTVYLMARLATLTDATQPALLVLADTGSGGAATVPFGSGVQGTEADRAFFLAKEDSQARIIGPGGPAILDEPTVVVDAATNVIEASIPRSSLGTGTFDLAVAAGIFGQAGAEVCIPEIDCPIDPTFAPVAVGSGQAQLLDVAFRSEPTVSNWFDKQQALTLHDGSLDPFFQDVDLTQLADGTSVPWQATAGYHERVFTSRADISEESQEQGPKETTWQHYGLYLPTSWQLGQTLPLTVWLHWRGGTAHQAAAWTPRVFEQLGEERFPSNVVISPRGRGTSTWYTGAGHVDVLEAWDDVHAFLDIDEDRRYVSGYSMGGFGSYLFGLLYPDKFAGAYPISGAVTQGAWVGVDDQGGSDVIEANGGDANVELMYRLIENARNLPYVIHHGTNDELVPPTGVERMAAKFAELAYQYRHYRFLGYEHFTQAVVDEWAEGAAYLDGQVRDEHPSQVVYKRIPALEHEIETQDAAGATIDLDTDGAYWITDLQPRTTDLQDPNVHALADVTTQAIPDGHLTIPEAGVAAPGHSTPFVMEGLEWLRLACTPEQPCPDLDPVDNAVDADLTNVAEIELDHDGMAIDPAAAFEGTVRTDGPVNLTITGDWSALEDVVILVGGGQPDPVITATAHGLYVVTKGAGGFSFTMPAS